MLIDTHVHLNDEKYQDNLDEVINNAIKENVSLMIVSGIDKSSSIKAIELANQYEFIYASCGLHPSEVDKEEDLNLVWLEECLKNKKVIAIGEIGLDYYWDKSFIDLQKKYFLKQIEIAKKYNLPIIVHSRDAALDTFNILDKNRVDGVLHCYSGSLEMAKEYVKRGYYLGIGGVITFKNNRVLKEVVEGIDIKYLLSETDAPYLAPTPFRGTLNQPAYVKYTVMEISKIKNIEQSIVEKTLANNTNRLFKI